MKKIVYATDYSYNSIAGLEYAYTLAQLLETDLIVLHVYEPSTLPGNHMLKGKTEIRQFHHTKLMDFCGTHLNKPFHELDLSLAIVPGNDVAQGILDFIKDMEVRMLVMGACGTSTLKKRVFGSTTQQILDISPFPVLAVPTDFKYKNLKRIVYSTSLEEEDLANIASLLKIIAPFNVKLIVIHITNRDELLVRNDLEEFKEMISKKFPYEDIQYEIIFSDDIFETMKKAIEQIDPDMVVMLERRNRTELSNLLHRDKVKRMQACTKVPLLSYTASHLNE